MLIDMKGKGGFCVCDFFNENPRKKWRLIARK